MKHLKYFFLSFLVLGLVYYGECATYSQNLDELLQETSPETEETLLDSEPNQEETIELAPDSEFEQQFQQLEETIFKEAREEGYIKTKKKPSFNFDNINPGVEGLSEPTGVSIMGRELKLNHQVGIIKAHQSTLESNFYMFKHVPHYQGYWELCDPKEVNLKGKRIALVVHGHHTTSLWKALSTYSVTNVSHLFRYFQAPLKKQAMNEEKKRNHYYGLDTLINLGRMLYQDIFIHNKTQPRYDYIIGYAYSSWGHMKGISAQFAKDINENLSQAKKVELFAHSMAGPMTRWALEQEGLGKWIHNCVFIASPHQGLPFTLVPGFIQITPTELLSTTDLITKTAHLDEDAAEFLRDLAFTPSPYKKTANYHTLTGYEYNTLTWDTPKEGTLPETQKLCPGLVAQLYYNIRFKDKIESDGLVPVYSSQSETLKSKSKQYARSEYAHAKMLPLDHRTITGDDLQPTVFDLENSNTPYKQVLQVLQYWISHWS